MTPQRYEYFVKKQAESSENILFSAGLLTKYLNLGYHFMDYLASFYGINSGGNGIVLSVSAQKLFLRS